MLQKKKMKHKKIRDQVPQLVSSEPRQPATGPVL